MTRLNPTTFSPLRKAVVCRTGCEPVCRQCINVQNRRQAGQSWKSWHTILVRHTHTHTHTNTHKCKHRPTETHRETQTHTHTHTLWTQSPHLHHLAPPATRRHTPPYTCTVCTHTHMHAHLQAQRNWTPLKYDVVLYFKGVHLCTQIYTK